MRKNCCSDREKLLKLGAEGCKFANFLRSLEQFIGPECFVNLFLEVYSNSTLDWLELKLEEIIGI